MRRFIHQSDIASARAQRHALAKRLGAKPINRQPLFFRHVQTCSAWVGENREGVVAGGEPIPDLARITAGDQVHLAEKFLQEDGAHVRMIVDEAKSYTYPDLARRIQGDDLSSPFGIEEIPQ